MQRTTTQPTPKPVKTLNALGQAFQDAKKSTQYEFRASLYYLSERDGQDYWRAFNDVWKYSKTLGRASGAILVAAHNVLGFNLQQIAQTK